MPRTLCATSAVPHSFHGSFEEKISEKADGRRNFPTFRQKAGQFWIGLRAPHNKAGLRPASQPEVSWPLARGDKSGGALVASSGAGVLRLLGGVLARGQRRAGVSS